MTKLWVLIADSSRAELVEVEGMGKKIQRIHLYDHPKGRAKNMALESDRPGRSFDRVGGQKHGMEQERGPHFHERQIFARQLMDVLQQGQQNKKFDEFAIIAPAAFLGELNHNMTKQLKEQLSKEVTHDIISIQEEKKRYDLMCKYLDLWNHD